MAETKQLQYSLVMTGTGSLSIDNVPASFNFMSILNNTQFNLTIKSGGKEIFKCPIYTFVTIPIPLDVRNLVQVNYEVQYSGPADKTEIAYIIFSPENLALNQTLFAQGGYLLTAITSDLVGLAKANQFPSNLSALGNLKVAIMEGLPLNAQGNLKVSVEQTASQTATVPAIFNVTMTNANTEYSQVLPANTKAIAVSVQSNDAEFRLAWQSGRVATPTPPYLRIPAGGTYYKENILLANATLYFACPVAGKVLQIEAWS